MSHASTVNLSPSNSSDATFRAWGSVVSAKLAAMGLVQTADTDQINWLTVVAPTTEVLVAGYEIWCFDDALQATAPIFIKIEYGAPGSNALFFPCLWVTIGSGSDGAGNLTGASFNEHTTTRCSISTYNTSAAGLSVFSGDTARVGFALFLTLPGYPMFLSIERICDEWGQPTATGVMMFSSTFAGNGRTNLFRSVTYDCRYGQVWYSNGIYCPCPNAGVGTDGTHISVYPPITFRRLPLPPGLNLLAYFHANVAAYSQVQVRIYRNAHTYYALGPNIYGPGMSTLETQGYLMRYE